MESVTYARSRLWLGITGVGSIVVLAVLLVALEVPARALEGQGGTPLADARVLLGSAALAALLALPFDWIGGIVLPRRFGRPVKAASQFLWAWLRGVLVLSLLWTANGTLLLAAGRTGGRPAALLAFACIAVLLILFQERLARFVGGLRRSPMEARGAPGSRAPSIILLDGSDPGFTGGFAGGLTDGKASLVLPRRWYGELPPRMFILLIERRLQILRSGAWRRALILAVLWNALGFFLASHLPNAGVSTPSELLTTTLGFTLWTFLGLLVLPTPSRQATLRADARAARDADTRANLIQAVRLLDRFQDDEPERSPGLESVFHPVPASANRVRALEQPRVDPPLAWNLARTALYLSYAGLSLLPRAVHCNVGRPELWIYMPADG